MYDLWGTEAPGAQRKPDLELIKEGKRCLEIASQKNMGCTPFSRAHEWEGDFYN